MAVSDCHQAIQATLNRESSDLSGDVVLVAESYGAFLAASLAAKYPAWYKTLILKDPLVDLSATAHSDQLLYWYAIQLQNNNLGAFLGYLCAFLGLF